MSAIRKTRAFARSIWMSPCGCRALLEDLLAVAVGSRSVVIGTCGDILQTVLPGKAHSVGSTRLADLPVVAVVTLDIFRPESQGTISVVNVCWFH